MGLTLCQCNIKLLFCYYFIIDVRFIFVEGFNVAISWKMVKTWTYFDCTVFWIYIEYVQTKKYFKKKTI